MRILGIQFHRNTLFDCELCKLVESTKFAPVSLNFKVPINWNKWGFAAPGTSCILRPHNYCGDAILCLTQISYRFTIKSHFQQSVTNISRTIECILSLWTESVLMNNNCFCFDGVAILQIKWPISNQRH